MLRLLAALVVASALLVAGGAAWLLGTQEGLHWALARAQAGAGPALELEGARGALLRELRFDRVAWRSDGLVAEARELSGHLSLLNLLTGAVRVDRLRAGELRLSISQGKADAGPPDLALPFRIVLSDAQLARVRVERPGAEPLVLSALRFSYTAGPGGHRLHNAGATTPWGRATLDATMAAEAPFEIEGTGTLERAEATVRARAVVHPLADVKLRMLEAGAPDIDLKRFDARLPRTRIDVVVRGRGTAEEILAGTATATNKDPGPLDAGQLPVRSLEARFSYKDALLALPVLEARAAGGALSGSARIQGTDRIEGDLRLTAIDLRAIRSTLRRTAIAGSLSLAWTPERQRARGLLEEKGMQVAGEAAREGDAFKATLGLTGIDPSRIGEYPAGKLNGSAIVSGRLGKARRLAARWSIADSMLAGEALSSRGGARLEGEGPSARLREVDAAARWAQNRLTARGDFGGPSDRLAWTLVAPEPPLEGFKGRVEARGVATGTLDAPRLEFDAQASPAEVAGRVRLRALKARGAGTLAAHEVHVSAQGGDFDVSASLRGGWLGAAGWQGEVLSLANRGRYPLDLAEPVALRASATRVELGRLRATLGDGRIALERLAWTPGRVESAGEFSGLPAAWLAGAAGLGDKLRSTLLLDGQWAIASSPELDGTLRIRRAAGDLTVLQPTQLELGLKDATLEASLAAGRVTARLDADARLGTVAARAKTGGIEGSSPLELEADLRLADIRVLAAPLPPQVRVGGRATLHVSARGTIAEPVVAARLAAEALSVHVPPYGVYLEDGSLRASLAGDRIQVDELRLRGGDGTFTVTGGVPLTAEAAGASLRWRADRLRVLGRPDLRVLLSGEGTAAVENRRAAVEGRLRVDEAYIERGFDPLPRLGDDVVVVGEKPPPSRKAERDALPLDLALVLDLGERFKVREAGFDGLLRGELRLATAKNGAGAGEIRAFGRISAADATYRAYGRTLAVDPGVLVFDGPLRNPALQIEAWRRNQEVAAGVRVTGNLEQPRVELISDPPLPEGAKLSWLVLGRAPSEASGADLAVLQTAASAMLGRGDSVPITTRIADAVGLDELAVRGSSQMESRVLAVGKRLSDRLYLSFEQGVGAVAQNLVKVDFSLTERISLRAQTGTASGAGVYYRYSWD